MPVDFSFTAAMEEVDGHTNRINTVTKVRTILSVTVLAFFK